MDWFSEITMGPLMVVKSTEVSSKVVSARCHTFRLTTTEWRMGFTVGDCCASFLMIRSQLFYSQNPLDGSCPSRWP